MATINRRDMLRLSGTVAAAVGWQQGAAALAQGVGSARRPNILLITGRDHPASGIGAYGGRLAQYDPTPALDRLAEQGTRFTHAIDAAWPPASPVQLSKAMGEAGYHTGLFGDGSDYHISATLQTYGHTADHLTDLALDWLAQRGDPRPFFLALHYDAPRDVFAYAPRHETYLAEVMIEEPDDLAARSLASGAADPVTMSQAYQASTKGFLRCVKTMDDNVVRLFAALEQAGLWDDTVIIYAAHRGSVAGVDGDIDNRWFHDAPEQMPLILRHPYIERPVASSDAAISQADLLAALIDQDANLIKGLAV